MFLLAYWWIAVTSFANGSLFAYANYWGAPIGTITLAIILVALTPMWIWTALRYWNWQSHTVVDD